MAVATVATEAPARPRSAGIDRLTVMLLTVAGFLAVLALLANQLRADAQSRSQPPIVLRKIYRTTVIETITGGSGPTGTSVSQSTSGAASAGVAAATTHTS
jgi:hypothetical protein